MGVSPLLKRSDDYQILKGLSCRQYRVSTKNGIPPGDPSGKCIVFFCNLVSGGVIIWLEKATETLITCRMKLRSLNPQYMGGANMWRLHDA